jgi:hydroxymethylglutaryl-CoA lyase
MKGIVLHEVGPRDGLQMERDVVPLEKKEAWIRALLGCGLDVVQVGSFVHPGKVPQMADTDRLFELLALDRPPHGRLSALVLNERGLERGLRCGVDVFCMGASASDTHSRKNTGMGTEEATRRIVAMARDALSAGRAVQVSVQSAFGCGFEGPIPEERVLRMLGVYLDAGLRTISLADTAGHAHPAQVERLFGAALRLDEGVELAAHFHNTYGLGMANIFAALRVGVRSIETSIAGLGGCPFTKVAAGNVATEDFVHALQLEGLRGEVSLPGLIALAREVAAHFGRDMQGYVYRTGPIAGGARS